MVQAVQVFRPDSARWVLPVSGVVAGLAAWGVLAEGGLGAWRQLAWPLLLAGAGWLVFWAPHLRVDADGVVVRNVLRSVQVPWAALRAVETRFALTLCTDELECQVWAAPVPGRHAAARIGPDQLADLPASTYTGAGVRPGDALSTPSGQAGYLVRHHWGAARAAGAPEPGSRAQVRWHLREVVVAVVLVVGAGSTLF